MRKVRPHSADKSYHASTLSAVGLGWVVSEYKAIDDWERALEKKYNTKIIEIPDLPEIKDEDIDDCTGGKEASSLGSPRTKKYKKCVRKVRNSFLEMKK